VHTQTVSRHLCRDSHASSGGAMCHNPPPRQSEHFNQTIIPLTCFEDANSCIAFSHTSTGSKSSQIYFVRGCTRPCFIQIGRQNCVRCISYPQSHCGGSECCKQVFEFHNEAYPEDIIHLLAPRPSVSEPSQVPAESSTLSSSCTWSFDMPNQVRNHSWDARYPAGVHSHSIFSYSHSIQ